MRLQMQMVVIIIKVFLSGVNLRLDDFFNGKFCQYNISSLYAI